MKAQDEEIHQGVKRGVTQLHKAEMTPDYPSLYEETTEIISSYTRVFGDRHNARFWGFAAEAITIAIGSRRADDEPPLGREEVSYYIEGLAAFLNTWTHP